MNPKGTNRSVKRTKEKLKLGLAELLKEKPANNITVREITDRIDMNRGTFYLYFKDVFDMMEQIETEMFEEYKQIVESRAPKSPGEVPPPILYDLYNFVFTNADMCLVLVGKNGDLTFVNKLKELMRDRLFYYWMLLTKTTDTEKFEYFYAFLISGCFGLFESWLKNGTKESPKEMAALTDQMLATMAKEMELLFHIESKPE
ncbi:MAG: TetR/AcrR family transcriptional regulator [Eubacteriales bacterium]